MQRRVRMIVPLTPQNLFGLEEASLLRVNGLDEVWLLEYVLAMWTSIDDWLKSGKGDLVYDQLAADLGESLMGQWDEVDGAQAQARFAHSFDQIYRLILQLCDRLRPYLGRVPDGLPDQPVEVITYAPFTQHASVLDFHLNDPAPNLLDGHGYWSLDPGELYAKTA